MKPCKGRIMTVKEITIQYLKENGFDGLYADTCCECACLVMDLMPCTEPGTDCRAGYKQTIDADSEVDFRIGPINDNLSGA